MNFSMLNADGKKQVIEHCMDETGSCAIIKFTDKGIVPFAIQRSRLKKKYNRLGAK